ncbi:GNAT family N-acetyltransferase [Rhodovulum sp. YNF3179]|uniref:GNAT family N-acetyltransferase n=1 Tax=Rhodovulum sp. YNF3179 TaxID=3425127 RepID=UPI003D3582F1
MSTPDHARLFAALDATWPAAEFRRLGPWTLRRGDGGGKRVSAATAEGAVTGDDIDRAESAMRDMGQAPLFMIRRGDTALDGLLAERGYAVVDPVHVFLAPVATVAAAAPDPMACFTVETPLAIMRDMWAAGGIGPERLAVMARAQGPRTCLFARTHDRPAGVGFVAIHEDIAMLHALEVPEAFRRRGAARNILGRAAQWAQDHDAAWFSAVTTGENLPAQRLFSGLGLRSVDNYHYRTKQSG